ncbi:membrane-spanning 4-domains subfamily A member 3 isoform X2 [Perognathus longimembris pacificus]|uniref:membrane-spanning 4-domains subfamily A member 3 isoform X2 n=1 Tax=Perognathus longimembris pacificus TaxID=214514 RepID=UPI002018B18E|nr:membrane-spanning 4-domains subfamily A member 3 isoform X2 [Perognathus longimembris pacificus]
MASQEVATDGLETEGAGTPGSQVESDGVNISIYRPLNESHYQEGTLQALGFISSGSLSVAAGRNPTRMLMQNSFGMNIASATIALVGTAFLSVHLALNSQSFKGCQSSQSPDLCIYMGSSSNGLVSLMLILTLLELAITITMSVMWCQGNFCDSREEVYPPSNPGGSEIPADESNAASINIRPPVSSEAALPPSAQEDGS